MNLICRITDKDIGEEAIEMKEPRIRLAARGIVIRYDGKVAIFHKRNKNEYKLPGGGIDADETPKQAFEREVLEETGCRVEKIEALGLTEEYKTLSNFKQTSYIFWGRVKEDTRKLGLTEKERNEGGELIWEEPSKALELISNCYDELIGSIYDSIYGTKFIVLRDRRILEYFIKEEMNK